MSSSGQFDPYHKWLGIPPEEQPPDHYRLLGIKRFERDPDVIDNAADGRMAQLRKYQVGQHAALSQRLLNEVAAARVCLLNATQREAYDGQLSQHAAVPPADAGPTGEPPPSNRPPVSPVSSSLAGRKRARWATPVLVAAGSAAIVVTAGAIAAVLATVGGTAGNREPASPPDRPVASRPSDEPQTASSAAATVPGNPDEPSGGGDLTPDVGAATASSSPESAERPHDQPPTADAAQDAMQGGAVLEVARMTSVPFGHVAQLPDRPPSAISFSWITKPKSADVRNGLLEFSVQRGGEVYLVTNTAYEGNRSGGWWEERLSKEQLVARGWVDLGPCPWKPAERLLKRTVQAGESYRIRTNKYNPPQLIVPEGVAPDQTKLPAAEPEAAAPPFEPPEPAPHRDAGGTDHRGETALAPVPVPMPPSADANGDEPIVVRLAEPYSSFTTAAGGKYLVFHLKQARKLVVLDVEKEAVAREIADMPEDVMLCGGAEKLLLVMPGQRMIQRWNLDTFERERVAAIPGDAPRIALVGNNSKGPLLLWADGPVTLVNVDSLEPIPGQGKVLEGQARYPLRIDVSADGATFGGIVTGMSSQRYSVMKVRGRQAAVAELPESTSNVNRWAKPSADGSLLFLPNGRIHSPAGPVSASWLEGSTCYPTPDPSYLISVRFVGPGFPAAKTTQLEICSTADRRVLYTVKGLVEMAPRGNDNARSQIERRLLFGEPRFHFFPQIKRIVTLPYDDTQVCLRKLDLDEVLKGALIVTSSPPAAVHRGRSLTYAIKLRGAPEGVSFQLESGPDGVQVRPNGQVQWRVPRNLAEQRAAIIVRIRSKDGKEIFHTIDLAVE